MSPCTGSRVDTKHRRIASCVGRDNRVYLFVVHYISILTIRRYSLFTHQRCIIL